MESTARPCPGLAACPPWGLCHKNQFVLETLLLGLMMAAGSLLLPARLIPAGGHPSAVSATLQAGGRG